MRVKAGLLFIVVLLTNLSFLIGQDTVSQDIDPEWKTITQRADSLHQQSWEQSVQFLDSLSILEKIPENICRIYLKVADILSQEQFYESSLRYLHKANTLQQDNLSDEQLIALNVELGKVNRRLGNYDQALKYDLEALKILDTSAENHKKALILNYIGIDHYRYHNFEEAVVYFNRSIAIRKTIEDSIGIADCWNNLGMVYDDMGEMDSAFRYYEKSLAVYQQKEEYDGIAAAMNNMAGIYYQQGNLDMVMELMLQAVDIRRKGNDKRKLSFTLLNTASLYFALGDIEASLQLNMEGLQLANEIGAKSQKKIAYEGLSEAYKAMGEYPKAYEYRLLYNQVKDSIFEENKSKAMAEMHISYETEKKEYENQLLRKDNEIKTRNLISLTIIATAFAFLILLLVYYLRLRNKNLKQQQALAAIEMSKQEQEKKHLEDKIFAEKQINRLQKEKYESEIELKNKQLITSTLTLVNKNEVLGSLKNQVAGMNVSATEKREVISYINQNLDVDANWKAFRIDFEAAHPGFFDRLNEQFLDMSDVFQKLCAYLRIDLSSREIADLMNVSVSAVNKNRQRLRKKLKLQPEADLGKFLQEI